LCCIDRFNPQPEADIDQSYLDRHAVAADDDWLSRGSLFWS
jgi:hypothetical protein